MSEVRLHLAYMRITLQTVLPVPPAPEAAMLETTPSLPAADLGFDA